MPRGITKYREAGLGPSENTKRLIEAMRDLEERIAAEKAKDRARALLLQFAQKNHLTAVDLRNAARVLADRKVGDAPIQTKNSRRVAAGQPGKIKMHALKTPKGKVGKAIRRARIKLKISDAAIGEAIGCHPSLVGKWQRGIDGVPARFHERLTEVLKLPKGTFPIANGAAA